MARMKRVWKRKSKKERRNNKLWADGARESVLKPHIEPYADALARGWRLERDYSQKVFNEFHARIRWDLPDDEEPELPLPDYDPAAPPVEEELDDETRQNRHARIQSLNERIQRWLKYRARKLRRPFVKADNLDNPYAPLLRKLAGIKNVPKARQAYQQYMRERYDADIGPVVKERLAAASTGLDGEALEKKTTKKGAPFRAKIARELFAALPLEEQLAYQERAKADAEEARTVFNKFVEVGPPSTAAFKQQCIDNFGDFMAPIMRGIYEYTGLQGVVIFGGPMPDRNGELGTIHCAIGHNLAPSPVSFPAWAKDRFRGQVLGLMKEYLETAYSELHRKEAALPHEALLERAQYRMEDDAAFRAKETGSSSDSGSDSDSSDEEDSDSPSENEQDNLPVSGKRRVAKGAPKGTAKGKASVGVKRARGKEGEGEERSGKRARAETSEAKEAREKKEREEREEHERKERKERERRELQARSDKRRDEERAIARRFRKELTLHKQPVDANGNTGPSPGDTEPHPSTDDATGPGSSPGNTVPHPSTSAGLDATGPSAAGPDATGPSAAGPDDATGPGCSAGPDVATGPSFDDAIGSTIAGPSHASPSDDEPMEGPVTNLPATCPAEAPPWFRERFVELTRIDLGTAYSEVLQGLVELEQSYGYRDTDAKLPTKHRPKQVTVWFKEGRKWKDKSGMRINDTQSFADGWWMWWEGMQPQWRVQTDCGKLLREDADGRGWGSLVAPGDSGLLVVVATLNWWGFEEKEKAGGANKMSARWAEAAADVLWVLKGLKADTAKHPVASERPKPKPAYRRTRA